MIGRIRGKLVEKEDGAVVVEAGGVGYEVFVPSDLYNSLKEGSEVLLHTVYYVKEDEVGLYGFSTKQEKKLFRSLLKISGVGPKTALAVLSTLGLEGFLRAIKEEDVKAISRVPGIGKKGASRIILEMRNVLPSEKSPGESELLQALRSLGFTRAEVEEVVREVSAQNLPLEEAVKEALRRLGR